MKESSNQHENIGLDHFSAKAKTYFRVIDISNNLFLIKLYLKVFVLSETK